MPGDQLFVDYGFGTITATDDDFVLRQWEQLAVWHNRHLRCAIGPRIRIGHSSDGDSRCGKDFMSASTKKLTHLAPEDVQIQDNAHKLKKLRNELK